MNSIDALVILLNVIDVGRWWRGRESGARVKHEEEEFKGGAQAGVRPRADTAGTLDVYIAHGHVLSCFTPKAARAQSIFTAVRAEPILDRHWRKLGQNA